MAPAAIEPAINYLLRSQRVCVIYRAFAAVERRITQGRGCSSGVEHDLAKVGVVGSNPIARSNLSKYLFGIGEAPIYT